MKFIFTNILIILTLGIFAQEQEFQQGNEAYRNENYDSALEEYKKLIGLGWMSPELYYNLGNTYYRDEELGKAIWAYETAVKIDPNHKKAKSNLQYAKAQTVDKIDNFRPGIGTWLKGLLYGPRINLWAWASIGSGLLFSVSIALFFLSKNRKRKNFGLFAGMASVLILAFTTITAHYHKQSILERTEGVIISDKAEIKLSPLESAKTSFEINEGTKVQLHETNEDWIRVEINGNSGWVIREVVWEV